MVVNGSNLRGISWLVQPKAVPFGVGGALQFAGVICRL